MEMFASGENSCGLQGDCLLLKPLQQVSTRLSPVFEHVGQPIEPLKETFALDSRGLEDRPVSAFDI